MRTYRFYKEDDIWFIDLKWFPKRFKHHLAMVAGADELLDIESEGRSQVYLEVGTKAKRSDLGILNRRLIFPGIFLGAIYEPLNRTLQTEILKKNQLWLCWVTLLVFGRYPKTIYYRVCPPKH